MILGFCIGGPDAFSASQADLQKIFAGAAACGATKFRVELPWAWFQPQKGQWDWNKLAVADSIVNGIVAAGMKPVLILFRRPTTWTQSFWWFKWSISPTASDYNAFVTGVVYRYANVCSEWEIWNEPNNEVFWGKSVDPAEYTNYLKTAYTTIKKIQPASTVIAGCSAPQVADSPGVALSPVTFMQQVYRAGGKGFFDAWSWHPYTFADPNPAPSLQSPTVVVDQQLRDCMLQWGDDKPVRWTEMGYGTDQFTPQQQTANLRAMFQIAQARPWVSDVYIYSYRDDPTSTGIDAHFGVVDASLTPKDAWHALSGQ